MSRCHHTAWAELLEGKAGPILTNPSRLSQLVQGLSEPANQYPQFVFFIGREFMGRALRYPRRHDVHRDKQKTVRLQVDKGTLSSKYPRFYADWNPSHHTVSPEFDCPHICHYQEDSIIEWRSTDHSLHDIVLSRLFFLFTDVLCLFSDDLGGLDAVRTLLLTWARIGSASSLHRQVRPRVMIVINGEPESSTQSVLDEQELLLDILMPDGPPFFEVFADIRTYRIPPDGRSSGAQFTQLHEDLSKQLDAARKARERHKVLFSALHVNAFFGDAIKHTAKHADLPFDFIRSSRSRNPLDMTFASHLGTFLTLGTHSHCPYEGLTSYIASAILMDAYPPRAHGKAPKSSKYCGL